MRASERLGETQSRNGFTLIELIIVIIVLGVLAVVLLPRVLDISKDAKNQAVTHTAQSVRQLISDWQKEQYVKKMINSDYSVTGIYPGVGGGSSQQACWDNPPDMVSCFPTMATVRMLVTGSTNDTQALKDFPTNSYQNSGNILITSANPCINAGNGAHGWLYNSTTGLFWANNYAVDGMTDVWCVDIGNPTSGMGTGTP